MLCIKMEVEPELRSSTHVSTVAVAKITGGKGIEGGEKKSLCILGASYSTSNKLLLVARHILTTGLQKCL